MIAMNIKLDTLVTYMSRQKLETFHVHLHTLYKYQTWWGGVQSQSHISFWLCGHLMSRDITKTLFLQSHKTYRHKTWQSGNLGWRATTLYPFDHAVMLKTRNAKSQPL